MAFISSGFSHRNFAILASPVLLRTYIFAAFIVHVVLAYTRNVNWDEFFYLSHVYAHLDGRLDRPLQTAFVHAFSWVQYLPGYESEQISVLRLLMTGFLAITCYGIYRIAALLSDANAALIAVIAFMTSGFVFGFGSNFRADPMAAAGLMSALTIIMVSRMSPVQMIGVAILAALSLLVTIKAILYLPAFLGAVVWRWKDPGVSGRIIVSGCFGVILAGLLYGLHSSGVVPGVGRDTSSSMNDALRTALLENSLFTRWQTFKVWILLSASSVVLAIHGIRRAESRRLTLTLVAFTLPFIVSLIFYRNAFDYFLPYIVPPMIVVVAVGVARVGEGLVRMLCLIIMLSLGIKQAALAISEDANDQRATLEEVHRLFPEPVYYIDEVGMVSSFKRSTFFMSSWGVTRYRAMERPAVREAIARYSPPLLLANRALLRNAMERPEQFDNPSLLVKEDREALHQTYVHYAGAVWLAGRSFTLSSQTQEVSLPFDGRYRLDSLASIVVNGETMQPGATVTIEGPFTISGVEGSVVRFIWDTGIAPKDEITLEKKLFAQFWSSWLL